MSNIEKFKGEKRDEEKYRLRDVKCVLQVQLLRSPCVQLVVSSFAADSVYRNDLTEWPRKDLLLEYLKALGWSKASQALKGEFLLPMNSGVDPASSTTYCGPCSIPLSNVSQSFDLFLSSIIACSFLQPRSCISLTLPRIKFDSRWIQTTLSTMMTTEDQREGPPLHFIFDEVSTACDSTNGEAAEEHERRRLQRLRLAAFGAATSDQEHQWPVTRTQAVEQQQGRSLTFSELAL